MTLARTAVVALVLLLAQHPGNTASTDRQDPGGRRAAGADPVVHQRLQVRIDPTTHEIAVTAEVRVPAGTAAPFEFELSGALRIATAEPAIAVVARDARAGFVGNNAAGSGAPRVSRYRLSSLPADGRLRLSYAGPMRNALSAQKEEYARGFRETAGWVGTEGVYLAGSSYWHPQVDRGLYTFDLEVTAPAGWHVISQGSGTSRGEDGTARWRSDAPMDEIYLTGGPLQVWRDQAGRVETLVYLRTADPPLASRYLEATRQYLDMYSRLVGPYPYDKFALVENFWETGYGMPSFTLLGSSVIRFPWILTSSYPHEILHNWWGNGVFVDYARGNWSEGLTAYLADHLIQEQRGQGAEHRRATLQKYLSYVGDHEDFPLADFRGRESAATEAVGYGKMLMLSHMLRLRLGDEAFRGFLARFYREHRGKRASFADLQAAADAEARQPLAPFFEAWVARPGAPALALGRVTVRQDGTGFVVDGTLEQRQTEQPFPLDVPVVVQTEGGLTRATVSMTGRTQPYSVRTETRPLLAVADPQFDVFRRLDPREVPSSIGQIFGAPEVTVILPSAAAPDRLAAYRELAGAWQSDSHKLTLRLDTEATALPTDRPVWVFGLDNALAATLLGALPGTTMEAGALTLGGQRVPRDGHAVVLTARHPANDALAVGLIDVGPRPAFGAVARKLPHYGRYSYLAFEGDEATNTVKGEWAPLGSPLRVDLRPAGQQSQPLPPLAMPARKPLAELPAAFSQDALTKHVTWLAAPEREGRGLGTPGLEAAGKYVADQFTAIGLEPGGDNRGWFQRFTIQKGPAGTPVETANIVGLLRGAKAEWKDQSVLVTAHYDHLGRGWPDAHQGDAGSVHPGADDNASGVAVLIELARTLAAGERPDRTVVFVAFSGEEAGLRGSAWYAEHPGDFPVAKVMGVVNIDTVGRLGSTGRVSVLGAGSATEWPHIFRGASFVTGVESVSVSGNAEASDQRTFLERGIPAVQIFTGPHTDYHRPGDTADKVDGAGLVKVATLVREAVVYLGGRAEPLTVTITGAPKTPAGAAGGPPTAQGAAGAAPARRVTFGTVPDFAFEGPGLKLSGVTPGSPAEKAGLLAGDVITRVADRPIASLRDFSEVLKTLGPGQSVPVVFTRGGQEQTVAVRVAER